MAAKDTKAPKQLDFNVDRYPTFTQLIARIQSEAEIPDVAVERLEITCLASGDATYRYWTARAEEPEGGYLPPPE